MRHPPCVQAIYPLLIIVIVSLNWSPIEHGITDVNLTGHRTSRAPIDGHEGEGITMSTVVMTDTLHSRYTQEVAIGESEGKDVEAVGV